eukprot:6382873-Pyramimonas_sp.AAC.1
MAIPAHSLNYSTGSILITSRLTRRGVNQIPRQQPKDCRSQFFSAVAACQVGAHVGNGMGLDVVWGWGRYALRFGVHRNPGQQSEKCSR